MRHGEVRNPEGILYGRMPGFHLSDLGVAMAQTAADDLKARDRRVIAVIASPLQRTQESAAPIAAALGLPIETDARLIEPTNHFEGAVMARALRNPLNWPWLVNPLRPSWGESYRSIQERMLAVLNSALDRAEASTATRSGTDARAADALVDAPGETAVDGAPADSAAADAPTDVVLVSHQLPIWVAHLSIAGERFMHDPRERRCSLSSITTFERHDGQLVEVGYSDPAAVLAADPTDVGAV